MSASNSDLDELINSDDRLDKLMKDLESIDQPLAQKRLRLKKMTSNKSELNKSIEINNNTNSYESTETKISEEEKRRRKNKDQVKILQNEYIKTPNWTRPFMKDLAKKTGLKAS